MGRATRNPTSGGGDAFTYDDDGNLTSIANANGHTIYTWNAENRLISVQPDTPQLGDKKLEFIYDYMGRRVKKSVLTYDSGAWVQDSSTTFLYDGWNMFKETTTLSGEPQPEIKYYTWGLDLSGSLQGAGGVGGLIAVMGDTATPSPDLHFFTYDANGNVGQLIDAVSGNINARYEYDAYGNELVAVGVLAISNPYRFSTKYLDNETGLYYYGYRYYISWLGRWGSRDPIEEEGGFNLYGIVGNDVTNYVDMLGLEVSCTPFYSFEKTIVKQVGYAGYVGYGYKFNIEECSDCCHRITLGGFFTVGLGLKYQRLKKYTWRGFGFKCGIEGYLSFMDYKPGADVQFRYCDKDKLIGSIGKISFANGKINIVDYHAGPKFGATIQGGVYLGVIMSEITGMAEVSLDSYKKYLRVYLSDYL